MLDLKKTQEEVESFWKKENINEKLLLKGKGKECFVLDGPPYANGTPHIGHIKNTVFKDLIIRLNLMKGKKVLFQPGFDTHGLPIENMVEKKLGLNSKKDIETFGISKFTKECRNNAALNKELWMQTYKKLGSLYIMKEPYLTYENYYLNSGWWTFKKMYENNLLYEGEKPVMWCPHCETSLAGYEVTDSYKDVTDPGIYVLFKLENKEEYLLVYTTTPWTLPGNVAIAISPEENYVKADIAGKKVILGEKRLEKLSSLGLGYNILETFKGKKLVGKKYEPLLDIPLQKTLSSQKIGKAHEIVASIALLKERVASKVKAKKNLSGSDLFEEFVTMSDGTGLVHVAPGHGKTDYIIGQHYKLACVSPVDDHCNLTPESGFTGFVKKADKDIMKKLEDDGKLLAREQITHSYPLCWRCKSPLIFRLSKQLFFSIEKIKKLMLKENKKVSWLPEFAKERFNNWIENAEDWNISRQRYWGIPIPLWKCECGQEKAIESKEELEKLSKKRIEDMHSVDIEIPCKCGKNMKRFKGIFDVWFDSGIAPWASLGYPMQNKILFEKHFPVYRINEAQDQIRGWFYSLMFCSVAVFSKAPYQEVSMVGWVVDKNGNKMSKSVGNVVDAEEAINSLGSDMLRYYFCWDVAPSDIQKFNLDIAKKEIGKILNVVWNLKNLVGKSKSDIETEDKWIISRLNSMTKKYQESIEKFETHNAMKEISSFILNDLSRAYIQMTRDKEKASVISTCLVQILKLLSPISPFITESIWQDLRNKNIVKEESVHLSNWPEYNEKDINDVLEKEFETIAKVLEIGLAERDKAKIGLRWPLGKAIIATDKKISKESQEIIAKQLNVKKIELETSSETLVKLDTTITPDLEAEGFSRELARNIQSERKKMGLQKNDEISLKIYGNKKIIEMFGKNLGFLKERVNAKKIEFSDDKTTKDQIVFTIKDLQIGLEIRNFKGTV